MGPTLALLSRGVIKRIQNHLLSIEEDEWEKSLIIPLVDLNKTVIQVNGIAVYESDNTTLSNTSVTAHFRDDTQIDVFREGVGSALIVNIQVIEFY